MEMLVIGSLAFDSVHTPSGQREALLGGSASFIATAASYFARVAILGVVGDDFPQEHLQFFVQRGIDTSGIQVMPGKTFRWRGVYHDDLSVAHTLETQLNVLKIFQPVLPVHVQQVPYVFLGNIDPLLQLSVLQQLTAPKFVACDTMNYWITKQRHHLQQVLKQVDLLAVNEAEARQLSGEHNLCKAAAVIQSMGPSYVVIKRGECGVLLFEKDNMVSLPAVLLPHVCDPTGAGDTFAGGMLGYLARCNKVDSNTLRQAVVMGSVFASFVVEQFSLDALRDLSVEAINQRLDYFFNLTHVNRMSFV